MHAEHAAEHQHHGDQRAGEAVELLAVGNEGNRRGLVVGTALLFAAVQHGVAQRLAVDGTADHHAGGTHAEHKVQQNAGQQGEAEGVDGAGGGRSEPPEDGVKDLCPEAVGGTEGAHQQGGNDNDGDVAVDDGGKTHLEAAVDSAVQRLVFGKLFLDALGGDDVGVNAHTDAEDDTGNAGQGQSGTAERREITGYDRQRGSDLTRQRDDGDGAGQTVAGDHQHRDDDKGDDTRQHHDLKALGAQGGADGGVAFGRQGKGQRAGVDLVRQRGSAVLREVALDDGFAVGDGLVDGGNGDALVIEPDGDGGAAARQLGGGVRKSGRALGAEAQLNDPALGFVVADGGGSHVVAAEDLLAVGGGAFAEYHLGSGADLVNGGLGVEVRLAGFPRKTHDDTVFVGVGVAFVIGDAKTHQTVLDNRFGGRKLLIGGVHVVRGHKGDIHAAADINAETDVGCTLDVGVFGVAVLIADTEDRSQGKYHDQNCHDE